MTKETPPSDLTYEEAFAELEAIVDSLDSEELELEESLALFERGQALAKHCSDLLEAAELKLTELVTTDSDLTGEGDLGEED